jgi:hypothetical protein
MDGPALHPLGARSELALESLGDLTRGFVGKGEDADPGGIHTKVIDEIPHPLDQTVSFPRSRAGQHEQGARVCFDGDALQWRRDPWNESGVGKPRRRFSVEKHFLDRGVVRAVACQGQEPDVR